MLHRLSVCAGLAWIAILALPLPATAQPGAPALSLEQAEQLALADPPLLAAQSGVVRAARERAVALGELPDPMLLAGLSNVPVNGGDRYRVSSDPMTMASVGLMQEFPLPGKRDLRRRAESLVADAGAARLAGLERAVRRDTALAWIDAWYPERAAALARALADEAERERAAAAIAYRSGQAAQAEVLAADVDLEMLRDRVQGLEQDAAAARARLMRWTAQPVAAIAAAVPALPEPPVLERLLSTLERHPELAESRLAIAAAQNEVAAARQAYWPDWRLEAMYGWREAFDEMVSLQVGIDLPVFRGDRQDRVAASAQAQLAASEATRQDRARTLQAAATAAYRAWHDTRARLARYDTVIVPTAQARVDAALAAYRAGRGGLDGVLAARRAALDAALLRLELQRDLLARLAELRYLNMDGA